MSKKPSVATGSILKITPYVPGKQAIKSTAKPIRLASNENPFGASPKAKEAIRTMTETLHRYPEGSCQKLRAALGKAYDISPDRIVCSAGSDELIALLCQAYAGSGDEVLYSEYGFLMYPISALRVGAKPIVAKEQGLKASIKNILAKVTHKTRIVFLANPNNPTGSYLTAAELKELRDVLPSHVILAVDAAYAEYVEARDYSDGLSLVSSTTNTVMIRTFSKIYGLASLRVGWAYCPSEIADILNRVRGPFNVSYAGQLAAIAALNDKSFITQSRAHNSKWLKKITTTLRDYGLKVYPSEGNFVLVEFPKGKKSAQAADAFLQSKGIIVRRMEPYHLPKCLRFTVGLEKENRALLAALKAFLDRSS